jgi:hypothetical protein
VSSFTQARYLVGDKVFAIASTMRQQQARASPFVRALVANACRQKVGPRSPALAHHDLIDHRKTFHQRADLSGCWLAQVHE